MRRLASLAVILVLVAACGPGTTTPADVTPDPQTASAQSGRFTVTFTVDRTTLRTGDSVTGHADLSVIAGNSGLLSGPNEIFTFEFVEVGGQQRRALPASDDLCAPHQIGLDSPLTTPIYKSSGVAGDADPNAAFLREFLPGEAIHLPAGEWDITAIAGFVDGRACAGQPFSIRTTVRVHVS
ncbi:MAG TPA: hypothetical protein VM451_11105 [Candidatus Limnocylindria bacterium]|nr:hypothetical protein [Candidatus Limnocylindria bacterium]